MSRKQKIKKLRRQMSNAGIYNGLPKDRQYEDIECKRFGIMPNGKRKLVAINYTLVADQGRRMYQRAKKELI